MKRRAIVYVIILYLLIILQTTLIDYIKVYNVKPNLLLVFIISAALLRGRLEGACIGVAAGFLMDIFSGGIFGVCMLAGLYAGFANGSANFRLYKENYMVVIFFTFVTTVLFEVFVYLLNAFIFNVGARIPQNIDFLYALKNVVLPETIYNSIIAIPVYLLLSRLNSWFDTEKKNTAKY
jgi:rod shape-determining protein MreD